ncbi:MAG: MFS transporter [Bacillus sp. (in: firmicutes)]
MNTFFYLLWSSISLGKLAFSLYTMAMTVALLSLTGSAVYASLIMVSHVLGKLSSTFLFPFISEKYSLNKILSVSLLVQVILIVLIAISANVEVNELWISLMMIYLLIGLAGFADGFISPARISLVPAIVSTGQIGRANSYISTTDQLFLLLGWSLGAAAISEFGFMRVLAVSIVLLSLSFICSVQIKINTIKTVKKRPKLDVIKEGWTYLFGPKNNMRTITMMDILEGIASGIWIGGISLVFVMDVLGKGEDWWGYINAAYCAGSIMGGLLMVRYAVKVDKYLMKGILIGSFGVSFLLFIYSINYTAWIALALVAIMGPFYQLRDISQQTYIQKVTPPNVLTKLYAAKDNLYYVTFALSVFSMGLISDRIGIAYVYYLASFLYLTSSIFAFIAFKKQPL